VYEHDNQVADAQAMMQGMHMDVNVDMETGSEDNVATGGAADTETVTVQVQVQPPKFSPCRAGA
jgi:hypothetical protein